MAAADYRLCDVCSAKTFYDAQLHYEDDYVRPVGVGDWVVICEKCAETHEVFFREKGKLDQVRAAPSGDPACPPVSGSTPAGAVGLDAPAPEEITKEDRDRMRCALGLDRTRDLVPWRNGFVTHPTGPEGRAWGRLVERGLANRSEIPQRGDLYVYKVSMRGMIEMGITDFSQLAIWEIPSP